MSREYEITEKNVLALCVCRSYLVECWREKNDHFRDTYNKKSEYGLITLLKNQQIILKMFTRSAIIRYKHKSTNNEIWVYKVENSSSPMYSINFGLCGNSKMERVFKTEEETMDIVRRLETSHKYKLIGGKELVRNEWRIYKRCMVCHLQARKRCSACNVAR